jgi:hypothetical protein
MEVLLDNKLYSSPLDGATLQDILCDLINNHLGGVRTLKEVKVNGLPYESAAMGQPTDIFRAQIGVLEVETLDAREVSIHFLRQAGAYLRTISLSSEKVAELFRVGDERETNEHYLRTLDSLQLFMQVLATTQDTLGLDFEQLLDDGSSPEIHLQRLAALVQEMLTAQEEEDWILLADLLQYDLVSALANWQEIVPQICKGVLS